MPCPCGNSVECCHAGAGVNTASVAVDATRNEKINEAHLNNERRAVMLNVPSTGICDFCTANQPDTKDAFIQKMSGLNIIRTSEWGIHVCESCVHLIPVIPDDNRMTLEDLTNAVPVVCSDKPDTLYYAFTDRHVDRGFG
jgi:hypothetical protein